MTTVRPGGSHRERSFGLSVGAVSCVLALALAWRGRTTRADALGGIGTVLLASGLVRPSLLKYPSDAWWALVGALGWVNARVLLSLLFVFILTPVGIAWRLMGRDPLSRRRSAFPGWQPSPERYRDRRHFDRMF